MSGAGGELDVAILTASQEVRSNIITSGDGATAIQCLTPLDVDGFLILSGAATLQNDIDVSGLGTFQSNVDVDANVIVSDTVYCGCLVCPKADLGATTLTTLNVSGPTTFNDNLTVGGTLGVTGATTLGSSLSVTGMTTFGDDVTVNGMLGVTGATTLDSSLGVSGATTLASTLDVTDDAVFQADMSVAGNICFTGPESRLKFDGPILIGDETTEASSADSIAIGKGATTEETGAVAIGDGATVSMGQGAGTIQLGEAAMTMGNTASLYFRSQFIAAESWIDGSTAVAGIDENGNFVKGARIDDLLDVNASGVSDGQVLTYDDMTSEWVASTIDVVSNIFIDNVGADGVGLFLRQTGDTFEFANIAAGSEAVTVMTDTMADVVRIDIDTGNINHNTLENYVMTEHIDHAQLAVNTLADSGLVGGDYLTANVDITLDIDNLPTGTAEMSDFVAFYDVDGMTTRKTTIDSFSSAIDHEMLANIPPNEHIDHSEVFILGGEGLTGGSDITANVTLALDIDGLPTAVTPDPDTSLLVIYNPDTMQHEKSTVNELLGTGVSIEDSNIANVNSLFVNQILPNDNDYVAYQGGGFFSMPGDVQTMFYTLKGSGTNTTFDMTTLNDVPPIVPNDSRWIVTLDIVGTDDMDDTFCEKQILCVKNLPSANVEVSLLTTVASAGTGAMASDSVAVPNDVSADELIVRVTTGATDTYWSGTMYVTQVIPPA